MISRSRSAPTAAAISIECTPSADSTETCLYSADRLTCVTGAPHSLQHLEFSGSSAPHDPQNSPGAVSPPSPWCPHQYRFTAAQRCPSYRCATSDTKFETLVRLV